MTANSSLMNEPRVLAVRIANAQRKAVRRIAVEHDLTNPEVVAWALRLLIAHEAAGGIYGPR